VVRTPSLISGGSFRDTLPPEGGINAADFYAEYYGHPLDLLEKLHEQVGDRPVVWLAGDSTLDNKHWFQPSPNYDKPDLVADKKAAFAKGLCQENVHLAPACNGYENVLYPPVMVKDVAYWMNRRFAGMGPNTPVCINLAVEESDTASRPWGKLTAHDEFIRDRMKPEDILILSVGGNDIALRPKCLTICNMGLLVKCFPRRLLKSGCVCVPPTYGLCGDGGGCVTGYCLACCFSCPTSLGYFGHLFRNRTEAIVRKICAKTMPSKVLPCMLYNLDEAKGTGWAEETLEALGYNDDPSHLQDVIKTIYSVGVSRVSVPGTIVVPVPMFEALDGSDTDDYCQRVEPSIQGGSKMAEQFAAFIGTLPENVISTEPARSVSVVSRSSLL